MKRYFSIFISLTILEILFYFSPFSLSELLAFIPDDHSREEFTVSVAHGNTAFDTLDMRFDGHIYIQASIGNDTTKYWFLLDTGAGISSIDEELLQKYCPVKLEKGINLTDAYSQSQNIERYLMPEVKIGTMSFGGFPFVGETREQPKCLAKKDNGIIGADIMGFANWLIDYKEKKIYVVRKNGFTLEGEDIFTIPFTLEEHSKRPLVSVNMNGIVVDEVSFDTGNSGSLDIPMSIYKENLPEFLNEHQIKLNGEVSGGVFGFVDDDLISTVVNQLEMENLCLDLIPVNFKRRTAKMLGNNFLKYYRVFVDYKKNEIKLQSNGEVRKRKGVIELGFGFGLKYTSDGKIKVSSLYEHSSADLAGIRFDDEIISINSEVFCGCECAFYPWRDSFLKSGPGSVTLEVKDKGLLSVQYMEPIAYEL